MKPSNQKAGKEGQTGLKQNKTTVKTRAVHADYGRRAQIQTQAGCRQKGGKTCRAHGEHGAGLTLLTGDGPALTAAPGRGTRVGGLPCGGPVCAVTEAGGLVLTTGSWWKGSRAHAR